MEKKWSPRIFPCTCRDCGSCLVPTRVLSREPCSGITSGLVPIPLFVWEHIPVSTQNPDVIVQLCPISHDIAITDLRQRPASSVFDNDREALAALKELGLGETLPMFYEIFNGVIFLHREGMLSMTVVKALQTILGELWETWGRLLDDCRLAKCTTAAPPNENLHT